MKLMERGGFLWKVVEYARADGEDAEITIMFEPAFAFLEFELLDVSVGEITDTGRIVR